MSDSFRESRLSARGTVLTEAHAKGYWKTRRGQRPTLTEFQSMLQNAASQTGLGAAEFFATLRFADLADGQPSPEALLALLLCERLACSEGSTFLELTTDDLGKRLSILNLEDRYEEIAAFINSLPETAPNLFAEASSGQVRPLLLANGKSRLYRHAFIVSEQNLAASIAKRLFMPWSDRPELHAILSAITETFPLHNAPFEHDNKHAIRLAPEQIEAALIASLAPLTIVAGGPGTGKTSVVVTILRLIARLGANPRRIALTAPTGRAANRLRESIGISMASIDPADRQTGFHPASLEPLTLHRLLGWRRDGRGYTYGRERPLALDWLILDEASMVDLRMMEQLFAALPDHARLIMLGDANQLPSVDAGSVFRDLSASSIDTNEEPLATVKNRFNQKPDLTRNVVRLKRTFRQVMGSGDALREAAAAIQTGNTAALRKIVSVLPGPCQQQSVVRFDPATYSLHELIQHLYTHHWKILVEQVRAISGNGIQEKNLQALRPAFERLDLIKILCLTRQTERGVDRINQYFASLCRGNTSGFVPGIPWMVTNNDYSLGVFNGDIGLAVFATAANGSLYQALAMASEDAIRLIPFSALINPQHAFAMTVHKSQGSECRQVVLILPDKPHLLCKREVVYTAITRAKQSAWIHGSAAILEQSVLEPLQRLSSLRETIQQEMAQPT